ncbi:nucleotidyltransferase family protein [Nitrospirillum iridis]|uniref:D-glycero-alpha-D-manno-heptose 1-phosphate guanylyltransferase n=1 Tax=Nitrospirillum iridis TaxID=765888 RepID=A0A7X0AZJ3_9PROT|nr:nucleotidyltransferase family protein [Nitrospirillum iridis]MBB6252920.1 D-glycero-alpha-D-manno-heptose 1-phosphate guanylyltransferase [Nitrospirillum iridis]
MTREAVILAGGLGTRLRAVVSDLPKSLAEVAGRPFLTWQLEQLADQGFSRIVLAVGYMHDKVTAMYGDSFAGMAIRYAVEETALGTGGAIWQAARLVEGDTFFALNGDTYFDLPAAAMEDALADPATDMAMAVCHVADCGRYGLVDIAGGRLAGFREKAPGRPGAVNAGAYLFRRALLDRWSLPDRFSIETDFLQPRLAELAVAAVPVRGDFIDIGIPEDYAYSQTRIPELSALRQR